MSGITDSLNSVWDSISAAASNAYQGTSDFLHTHIGKKVDEFVSENQGSPFFKTAQYGTAITGGYILADGITDLSRAKRLTKMNALEIVGGATALGVIAYTEGFSFPAAAIGAGFVLSSTVLAVKNRIQSSHLPSQSGKLEAKKKTK